MRNIRRQAVVGETKLKSHNKPCLVRQPATVVAVVVCQIAAEQMHQVNVKYYEIWFDGETEGVAQR